MNRPLSPGDRHLRTSVLFAVAVHGLFLVVFTVFLFKHADPMGDGMEMVGSSIAFMFIFLPFSLPAYLLAKMGTLPHPRGPSRADRVLPLFRPLA